MTNEYPKKNRKNIKNKKRLGKITRNKKRLREIQKKVWVKNLFCDPKAQPSCMPGSDLPSK
jgi:hypothetical protein